MRLEGTALPKERHWFFSRPDLHWKAAWEVVYMTGCGLLALLTLPIFNFAIRLRWPDVERLGWYDIISKGQLYPFAFSLVGTLFWLHSREYSGKKIPLKSPIVFVIWSSSLIATGIYAIVYGLEGALHPYVVGYSVFLLLFYSFLRYVLTVVRDIPVEDPQESYEEDTEALMSRSRARRAKK